MKETAPLRLSLAEAGEALAVDPSGERFSPLHGVGILVVELAGTPPAPAEIARIAGRIAALPVATLASLPEPEPAPALRRLADAFDAIARDDSERDAICAGALRAPLAALILVQLLRASLGRDVASGLVAESAAYSTLQAGPEFAAWLAARGTPKPVPPDTKPPVHVARCDGRLVITLDRPERHNAYSRGLRDGLCEALELARADPSCAEIVLRGRGASFCSGGDLAEFGSLPDPATAHAIRTTRSAASALFALRDRTRAELHGACIGAGIELPAFAARVVAREDARFQLPELWLGLVPGAGGTLSLPRRIGRQRTAYLALTALPLDAPTALRWGLVDAIA